MRQKWFRQILRLRLYIILLLLIQVAVLVWLILSTSAISLWLTVIMYITGIMASLRIISCRDKPSYKLLWVFLILLLPIFGGSLYLLLAFQTSARRMDDYLKELVQDSEPLLKEDACAFEVISKKAPECIPQMFYLKQAGFPVYQNTRCTYFPSGESVFPDICEEIQKAGKYIFLEFFIIQEGDMWNTIRDILIQKAREGVEVRVLYDDIGSFLTLPRNYPAMLARDGIQCRIFNPFRPVLSSLQNNRDHRKLIIIDGETVFTGGFNLADEYINAIEKFGYWKDCGMKLTGKAAWSQTLMFLQMWNLTCKTREDFSRFRCESKQMENTVSDGLVQPYADSPLDAENVGEHVYLQMINNAKNYLYINTPYLIVDDSMVSALSLAAKSGDDVRIITPHRWDKKLIHMTTRSYYLPLLRAGVKIYEYTQGFNHAKTFVSDDKTATVGTTNLDYRSLYLHFECGVWLYKNRAVAQVKEDFLASLQVCQEIQLEDCPSGLFYKHFQELLHVIAPLM